MSAEDGFLGRWSRRKHEARAARETPPEPRQEIPPAPCGNIAASPSPEPPAHAPLPPVESLTPESDFAPFMQRDIDPTLKGRALKTLFRDPALYPMDGLDVYIDDYSKPDPLPDGWLEKLNQFAMLDGAADPERPGDADASRPVAAAAPHAEASSEEAQPPESPGDTAPAPPMDRDAI
jgi:hypothetical protein